MRADFPVLLLIAMLAAPLPTPIRAVFQSVHPHGTAARLQSELTEAQNAMRAGDLSGAERGLRRALALDSNSLVALNELGIVLARQGKPAEAIPLYQRALSLRAGDPAIRRNLAIAYFKAEKYRSAWDVLQSLAVSSPTDFQVLDLAGLSLFALDRYPEAAKYLERANRADPSDLETLDMLGKAYLRMKNYKALPSVFERIMKINPNSAASSRSCRLAFSPKLKFFMSEVSQIWYPGPSTAPGREVPKCPTAGVKAAVLKNSVTVFGP
jgi:Flp pilus assembly protein TadD